jgi:hypothetical protein
MAIEFLALLSCQVPAPYESLTRFLDGIHVGAEVNELSSPLLLRKNKRATIARSSVRIVGPHA